MRRDQALEVVAGRAPVDAVIERRGRGIKISPDQGAPYAHERMVVLFAADGLHADTGDARAASI